MRITPYTELPQTPLVDDFIHMRYFDWTKRESDQFYRWFMEIYDSRLNGLLSYFHESITTDPVVLLDSIGAKIVEIIHDPIFHEEGLIEGLLTIEKGTVLSYTGHALSFDMGILLSRLLLTCCPSLKWTVTRRPKRYAFVNLPELDGFGKKTMCPIMVSNSCTYGVLEGNEVATVWSEVLGVWKEYAVNAGSCSGNA